MPNPFTSEPIAEPSVTTDVIESTEGLIDPVITDQSDTHVTIEGVTYERGKVPSFRPSPTENLNRPAVPAIPLQGENGAPGSPHDYGTDEGVWSAN